MISLSNGKKVQRRAAILKGLLVKAMKGDIDSADIALANRSLRAMLSQTRKFLGWQPRLGMKWPAYRPENWQGETPSLG